MAGARDKTWLEPLCELEAADAHNLNRELVDRIKEAEAEKKRLEARCAELERPDRLLLTRLKEAEAD